MLFTRRVLQVPHLYAYLLTAGIDACTFSMGTTASNPSSTKGSGEVTIHMPPCKHLYLLYMLFNTAVFSVFDHIFQIAEDL
jgi:hypothetical protein